MPILGAHNRMEVCMSLMHLLQFVTKQPTVMTMAIVGKYTILCFPLLTFFKEKPLQFHASTKFIYINTRKEYRRWLNTFSKNYLGFKLIFRTSMSSILYIQPKSQNTKITLYVLCVSTAQISESKYKLN